MKWHVATVKRTGKKVAFRIIGERVTYIPFDDHKAVKTVKMETAKRDLVSIRDDRGSVMLVHHLNQSTYDKAVSRYYGG